MAIYIPGKTPSPKGSGYTNNTTVPFTNDTADDKDLVKWGSQKFGTYHMADRPDLYEPLRTNNFEFIVSGLGAKLQDAGELRYYHGNYDDIEEILRISVDQAFVPHFTQSVVSVKRGNSTLKYAGQPTFNNGQIRIKDYIGTDAKMALMEWQNLSYDVKTEKVGLASDYKLDCILTEYTPDYIAVRQWKLHGCWISGISEGPFDSSSADNLNNITATIEYDRAEPWEES